MSLCTCVAMCVCVCVFSRHQNWQKCKFIYDATGSRMTRAQATKGRSKGKKWRAAVKDSVREGQKCEREVKGGERNEVGLVKLRGSLTGATWMNCNGTWNNSTENQHATVECTHTRTYIHSSLSFPPSPHCTHNKWTVRAVKCRKCISKTRLPNSQNICETFCLCGQFRRAAWAWLLYILN